MKSKFSATIIGGVLTLCSIVFREEISILTVFPLSYYTESGFSRLLNQFPNWITLAACLSAFLALIVAINSAYFLRLKNLHEQNAPLRFFRFSFVLLANYLLFNVIGFYLYLLLNWQMAENTVWFFMSDAVMIPTSFSPLIFGILTDCIRHNGRTMVVKVAA